MLHMVIKWMQRHLIFLLSVGLILGLLIVFFHKSHEAAEHISIPQEKEFVVRIRKISAMTRPVTLALRGYSQASKTVEIRAQTKGEIAEINTQKGHVIKQGDVLITFDVKDREAQLKEAKALLGYKELEYENSRILSKQSFRAQVTVAQALAELEKARAQLEAIKKDMEHTKIKSPIDGFLQECFVEKGDYADVGHLLAKVIDLSPLKVISYLPEKEYKKAKVGQKAKVNINSRTEEAVVTYLSRVADENTRTFRMELEIDNPNYTLVDGLTAEVEVPTEDITGHEICLSSLTLNDEGDIGVKVVDENNLVHFLKVEVVTFFLHSAWVVGLPDEVTIISTGQEFVVEGQKVRALEEDKKDKNCDTHP